LRYSVCKEKKDDSHKSYQTEEEHHGTGNGSGAEDILPGVQIQSKGSSQDTFTKRIHMSKVQS